MQGDNIWYSCSNLTLLIKRYFEIVKPILAVFFFNFFITGKVQKWEKLSKYLWKVYWNRKITHLMITFLLICKTWILGQGTILNQNLKIEQLYQIKNYQDIPFLHMWPGKYASKLMYVVGVKQD